MSFVPQATRLSVNARPIAGAIPALRLEVVEVQPQAVTFSVHFADASTAPMRVCFLDTSAWHLVLGEAQLHDIRVPGQTRSLTVESDRVKCTLRVGNATAHLGLAPPSFAFEAGDAAAWRSVGLDINVGDAPQSYPLFKHATGFGITFDMPPGDPIYGGGEDFGALLKNGRAYDLHNADALGVNGQLRYQSTPYLFSGRCGGLALLNAAPSRVDVGLLRHDVLRWSGSTPCLSLLLQPGGSPTTRIAQFRRAVAPVRGVPAWSLKLWLSRCYYRDQAEVDAVCDAARKHGVDFGVINLDARCWMRAETRTDFVWDTGRFAPYQEYIPALCKSGIAVCLWENPYVSSKTETLHAEGVEKGFFATTRGGAPYPLEWVPEGMPGFPKPPVAGLVDFTQPAARAWWKDLHRPFIRAGVRCFKTDFGEEIPPDAHFADGSTGWHLRNVYADLYNLCVSEVLQEEAGDDGIVWARSGCFAAAATPVKWGGDSQTSWRALRASLRGGLSQATGGALFWSHDIGGFYGPPPDPELYLRWAQMGLWGSHARCHGTTAREPWGFGRPVLARFREALRLRLHALPYLIACCRDAVREARSFMLPMWLVAPRDPACTALDDQFMAGPDVLVAPFVAATGGRAVYLPHGDWFDLRSGDVHVGGRFIDSPRTDHLPAFARTDSAFMNLWQAAPEILRAGKA